MSANSKNSNRTTPSVRLAGTGESLIQIALKLKNIIMHVSL